jgi:polysaccharide export outer membrane protein
VNIKNKNYMKNFILLKSNFTVVRNSIVLLCFQKGFGLLSEYETSAQEKSNSYEVKLQPDDLLLIIVSAEDPEIAAPLI